MRFQLFLWVPAALFIFAMAAPSPMNNGVPGHKGLPKNLKPKMGDTPNTFLHRVMEDKKVKAHPNDYFWSLQGIGIDPGDPVYPATESDDPIYPAMAGEPAYDKPEKDFKKMIKVPLDFSWGKKMIVICK